MTNRKLSDARRFDFCIRCLRPAGPETCLTEHHLCGRKNDHTAIVFICPSCIQHVEIEGGPIENESQVLSDKKALLITSPALRWVVGNSQPIVDGFLTKNKKGVGWIGLPGSGGWQPPFGAVGYSGRKYYFIPPEHLDDFVETGSTGGEDGIGGPIAGAWIRFKGAEQNILNSFLDAHDAHRDKGEPWTDVERLRQD